MKKRILVSLLVLVTLTPSGCICVSSRKEYKSDEPERSTPYENADFKVKTYCFINDEETNRNLPKLIQTMIPEDWETSRLKRKPKSPHRIYQIKNDGQVFVRTTPENHKKIEELIAKLKK